MYLADTLKVPSNEISSSGNSYVENLSEEYDIPRTPNVSSVTLRPTQFESEKNLVVLTELIHFLPLHILNVLLTQEYTVKGVIKVGDRDKPAELDSLFDLHPLARKHLFIQRVSHFDQRDWERNQGEKQHSLALYCTKTCFGKTKTSNPGECFKEDSWEDASKLTGDAKCYIEVEKEAWEFFNSLPEKDRIEFVVINPAFMLGPIFKDTASQIMNVVMIKALMESTYSRLPSRSLPLVDIRDVARAVSMALVKDNVAASPQQDDLRLLGPMSGQGTGCGVRTRDRGVPADLRAYSLATVPPTPRH
ncbi:NADPH-dependent aldehyde reductase ari1-like isoform x2 [Plakobranchus ocellatus]|uniref:NADPH-dependent aldehyde reductase ari1-like isoform x2 n=1 Tax=Plakobranchus ocellatus TaxID=259542 RepID=A0AAV3Y7H2_9GAST|nr:NADPH-dependent aldehyde reductase ari1-like isoform x2 [Plakobranchus ocellatus]